MSLKIVSPGLLTTVQDTGRYGYQKDGIIVSGAMDAVALRIANLLVGNYESTAALEITLLGPEIYFEESTLISLTGADLSPKINGEDVSMWRPVYVRKDSILTFRQPRAGCRAYLALSGGLALPKVMNSYSTYLRAGLGGYNGRALQAGDTLPCGEPSSIGLKLIDDLKRQHQEQAFTHATWTLDPQLYPQYKDNPIIRAVHGPEYSLFTESSKADFWKEAYQVTAQSDRMGYRLEGTQLELQEEAEMLSSAVTFGTVQVPAEGNPIILMADHQTTGGYPRIAQVATADFPLLAQVQPGKKIHFQEISLEEAQQLYMLQEQNIELIEIAIRTKTS